jgi:GNAT superfamily N-acetyltransferase
MTPDGLHVRHVLAGEQALLRHLRLASLAADPDAFGSTYERDASQPSKWWERWAAQSEDGTTERTFLLVDDEDHGLGLARVRLNDDDPALADLTAMWVKPEARGRRASVLLCEACAAWATERGADELVLMIVVDNAAAQRAFEAAGFAIRRRTTWSRDARSLEVFVMSRRWA